MDYPDPELVVRGFIRGTYVLVSEVAADMREGVERKTTQQNTFYSNVSPSSLLNHEDWRSWLRTGEHLKRSYSSC